MIKHVDGSVFNGRLEVGQVWVKGNREKKIVKFNEMHMFYQTKEDVKRDTKTVVLRSSFRKWLYSGAMLKVDFDGKLDVRSV